MRRYVFFVRMVCFLCVAGVTGCGLAVDEQRLQRANKQRDAVAAIKKSGGVVIYDYMVTMARDCDSIPIAMRDREPEVPASQLKQFGRDYFADVEDVYVFDDATMQHVGKLPTLLGLELRGPKISDAALEYLRDVPSLKGLTLEQAHITDKGLRHLESLTQLRVLTLKSVRVSDAGLTHLKGLTDLCMLHTEDTKITGTGLETLSRLPKLDTLYLRDSPVTDKGLEGLKGLTHLKWIELKNVPITGSGLVHFKKLDRLESLWLQQSPVTDAGLRYLEGLHLQHLEIEGTDITDAGVRRLRQALPGCNIDWHPKRKLVADCFPESVRPLFQAPGTSLEAEKIQGERIAKAIGDPVEVAVIACRALGAMDASWNFIEEDQRLALHAGHTVSGADFLKALHKLRGDRRGELGAARFCFDEGYDLKIPESERSEWTTYLARIALENDRVVNKYFVVKRLGKLSDEKVRVLLRKVARGEIAAEVTPWNTEDREPGLRGIAYVGLAKQGDESIRKEITQLLKEVPPGPDHAALEVCLALLGDVKYIKAEHFRFQSYVIGFAAIQAIEKFGGREGMDVLVEAGPTHPWAAVNVEAVLAIQRITGQTWCKDPDTGWVYRHHGEIRNWWKEHGNEFVKARRAGQR